MGLPDLPRRHDLVWPDPSAQVTDLATPIPAGLRILHRWLAAGRPLVAARLRSDTPRGHWALGLPLPPHQGKRRIAAHARVSAIRRLRPPPTLGRVLAAAPPRWQAPLRALEDLARVEGIRLRVFGSLAWQHLTGEPYVCEGSDIDLLWRPTDLDEVHRGIEILSAWERRFGLRADGEIELPDGSGLAWRELAAKPPLVLVKSVTGVSLKPLSEVLDLLAMEPHTWRPLSPRTAPAPQPA